MRRSSSGCPRRPSSAGGVSTTSSRRQAEMRPGARARVVVRALSLGYGLIAGIDAPDLEGVFVRLTAAPVGTDEDERSRLGIVLAAADVGVGPRILAAHWV